MERTFPRWKFFFGIVFGLWLQPVMHAAESMISMPQAITLGAVQGVTEFMPVSSTAHMILANTYLFHWDEQSAAVQSALKAYLWAINLGTLCTLLLFYRKTVARIAWGICGRNMDGLRLACNLVLALIPSIVTGLLLGDFVKRLQTPLCIAIALILGGLGIFALERFRKAHKPTCDGLEGLSWQAALWIGAIQTLAFIPGVSRLLMTLVGGIFVGLSLRQALHFSFLLGLCTTGIGTAYSFLKDGSTLLHTMSGSTVFAGILCAFIVGLFTIRFCLTFLARHGLRLFGWYRILLGVALLALSR